MKKTVLLLFIFFQCNSYAKIEIVFWHSMAGQLGKTLMEITDQFNLSQTKYNVIPVYKGTYPETLTGLVASFRAKLHPDIVQICDIGTATMIYPEGIIKPLYELLFETGTYINRNNYITSIFDYYSNDKNELMALPFNVSTAVLFYNKTLFEKSGIKDPPESWAMVEKQSLKLIENGVECGLTTTWPSWVNLESFSVTHNIEFASSQNGFKGLDVKLLLNNFKIIDHINRLYKWQKSNVFRYGGRIDDAQALFTSQKCAMLIQSSGAYADLNRSVGFTLGVSVLPTLHSHVDDSKGILIGGGSIWTLAGLSKQKHQGIAEFFMFLISPEVQVKWQSRTGYISIMKSDLLPIEKESNASKNVMIDIQKHIMNNTNKYKGIRLGYYSQIRDILDQQLEAVWAGYKSANQSMDDAILEGNKILKRFKKNVNINKNEKK